MEHSKLRETQQILANKEKSLSDKSSTLVSQNSDLAKKVAALERELGN